jgi:hypothetical protein
MLSRYLLSTLSALSLLLSIVSACPGPDCVGTYDASAASIHYHGADEQIQRPVSTITSSRCTSKSAVPYTPGSSTFWLPTPSCPVQTTVTSWVPQSDTCAAPQSGGLATLTLPAVTFTSYASGSPPATVFLPASTLSPTTYTTILSGSCLPNETYHQGSTYWATATQFTTVTSTIVRNESYPGPTVPGPIQTIVSTQAGSTIVLTQTEPGSTQYITQTEREPTSTQYINITRVESQAITTYCETTTISFEAITRTLTETSIALSFSPIETTVTGQSWCFPALDAKSWNKHAKYILSDIVPKHGHLSRVYHINNNGARPWLPVNIDYDSDR